MPKRIPFDKPALPLGEQVALMKSRGLVFNDEDRAKHYLRFIGYYRLVGYARFYRDRNSADPEKYLDGTTFDAALDLYIFDRKLRVLMFDAIERIEVAVKATMTDKVGTQKGAFWMSDANNFDYGCHHQVLEEIQTVVGETPSINPHQFISHFYSKYTDPYPPSWMLMECMSFGSVSRVYKLLKGNLRQPISAEYGLQHDIMESWLHAISFSRNVCAHHGRLWQRTFTIQPKIPKEYQAQWPSAQSRKLYIVCCILHHLMGVIADGSAWSARLRTLITERPAIPLVAMGFPENWDGQPFWGFAV